MFDHKWGEPVKFDSNKLCPCGLHGKSFGECCEHKGPDALGNAIQRSGVPRCLEGTRTETLSSIVNGDTRFRIVWNVLWNAPQEQTLHEFLDKLVLATLESDWFKEQGQLSPDDQNVIVRWRSFLFALLDKPPNTADGGRTFTGPVEAYMHLGYDLYWLQIHHKLPDRLIERLKMRRDFQGARYEILVAAVFARAGFDIEWLDDITKTGKRCEFIATHKVTGAKIAVETKSRLRSGALHFKGQVSPESNLRADIFGLYETAIKQVPTDGTASLIFIDGNWNMTVPSGVPGYSPIPAGTFPWVDEVRDGLNARWNASHGKTAETGVILTNFPYYYGNNEEPSPIGIGGGVFSPKPSAPINDRRAIEDLFYCLQHYDHIPRQI